MSILSPIQSRRFNRQAKEKDLQIITFLLYQEWFALKLEDVNKVILLNDIYGDPKGTGVSLTTYQNQELVVIDVSYKIFGNSPNYQTNIDMLKNKEEPSYLIILENSQGEKISLPIDKAPLIKRVKETSFKPLPEIYLKRENIKCLSSKIIEVVNESPSHYFLLDKNKLF